MPLSEPLISMEQTNLPAVNSAMNSHRTPSKPLSALRRAHFRVPGVLMGLQVGGHFNHQIMFGHRSGHVQLQPSAVKDKKGGNAQNVVFGR
jgi:hypothetical protein